MNHIRPSDGEAKARVSADVTLVEITAVILRVLAKDLAHRSRTRFLRGVPLRMTDIVWTLHPEGELHSPRFSIGPISQTDIAMVIIVNAYSGRLEQ